jgi:hypothetical protein
MFNAETKRSRARKRRVSSYHAPPPAAFARDDDYVLTFPEWCSLNRIGTRSGRRILSGPDGPVVTQLSTHRIGITRRANREWQTSRARA